MIRRNQELLSFDWRLGINLRSDDKRA